MLASDKISLEELFALDDSDTSANTTQAATAENSNMAASIQSDAIPPEVSGCEKDGTWQKILVEATGSNATLTLWTYRDGQWEKDLSTTAAIGANGLTTDKTEGDHMTPEGTFPICFAFSTKEKNTIINCFLGFLIGRFEQRQRIFDLCPSNSLCRMKKSL